jgi:hypothetical protein
VYTPHVCFDRIIDCGSSTNANGERLYVTQKLSQMITPLFSEIAPDDLDEFLLTCRRMNLEAVTTRITQIQYEAPDLPAEAFHFVVDLNFEGHDGKEARIFLVTHLTPLSDSTHELSIAFLDAEEVDAYLQDLRRR